MKTVVKRVPGRGRGVFADEDLLAEGLVEECELIFLGHDEVSDSLERYVFWYSPRRAAIALGNGSLYNHSSDPNAYFDFDRMNRRLLVRALRPIKKGEEITFDYGYEAEFLKKFNIV